MIITSTVREQEMRLEVYLDEEDVFLVLGKVKDLMDKNVDLNEEDEEQVLADAIEYIEDGIGQSQHDDLTEI